MISNIKWIIGLIVLAILGWFVWQSGWLGTTQPADQAGAAAKSTATQPASVASNANVLPTAQNDVSDAALAQDTAAIDVQVQGLSIDSAATSQSLNDKPLQ